MELHLSRRGVSTLAGDIYAAINSLPKTQPQPPTSGQLPQSPGTRVTVFSDSIFKYLPRHQGGVTYERHIRRGGQVHHMEECEYNYINRLG